LTATGRSQGFFNNIGEKQNISGNPNLDPTSFGFSSSQANGGNFVDQNGDAEEAAPRVDAAHHLSLSEIRSEHTDGVIRRELESEQCTRWPEQRVAPAHPCSGKGVFSRHCNMPYKKGVGGADAARRRRRHGQGIPAGLSQSAVPYVHSAMASGAQLAGHEFPWPPGENFAIDPVTIADDVAWIPFPVAGFGELPGHPFGGRVCRHAEP
jgi:hypothetical protein